MTNALSAGVIQSYEAENSALCLDNRHRKVYIGDSHGTVRCFNVNSGALIKEMKTSTSAQINAMENKKQLDIVEKDFKFKITQAKTQGCGASVVREIVVQKNKELDRLKLQNKTE
jgi:hypothetical protein